MDHLRVADKLERNAMLFKSLLHQVSDEEAGWKPFPEHWSLIEVINHLFDEEREDFRQRLQLVLTLPNSPWPPISPATWPVERQYSKRKMQPSLDNFLKEREKSVAWLRNLKDPDWAASHPHMKLGTLTAEQLLLSWLAHDYLHIRQMTYLQWRYLADSSPSVNLSYAGEWK